MFSFDLDVKKTFFKRSEKFVFFKRFVNVFWTFEKNLCFGANIRSKLDVLQTFFKRL